MQPPPPPSIPIERTLREIDVGCRAGFLVVTVLLGGFAVWLSWQVRFGYYEPIFAGLLKGQPLPLTTRLALGGKDAWLPLTASLMLLAGIGGWSIPRPLWALLTINACNLLNALVSLLLMIGLIEPIAEIIEKLS